MIEFENYFLTKISKDDAQGIHSLMIANVDRFQRYFPKTLETNRTLSLAKEFAVKKETEFDTKEEFLFVIKKKNSVIGLIYIKELDWKKKQGEYAYCIDSNFEGKGLMSRIINVLSSYAFAELGLKVLQIIVHKDNIGSVKVAEKCGFSWQKTLLNEYAPPNEPALDMELYELYNSQRLTAKSQSI